MATNDSLASLIDELASDINETVEVSLYLAADVAVRLSPEDTSRFKNAWRVGIDSYNPEESSDTYDSTGAAGLRIVENQVKDFDVRENESITLYNYVKDPESGFHYAATVGYDFTGGKAYDLLSSAEQTLYSALD